MLIEGAKMSSIERWDFRCCQQTSAISGEVPSSHPALKTQRLLMTEALVIPEATVNEILFFVLAWTLQKCWD